MMRLTWGLVLGLALLLSACGSTAFVAPPSSFPTAENLPTLTIDGRVINIGNGTGSGYKYLKLSLAIQFEDRSGQYLKANGDQLKTLQTDFAGANQGALMVFNDILTQDVSQQTPAQLASADGKEALRQQLIKDFNSRLNLASGDPPVLYVAFTDFVMQ